MFGGSLTHNAGSSGVAEKNLNRWTIIIGLTRFFSSQAWVFNPVSVKWCALIVTLGLLNKYGIA